MVYHGSVESIYCFGGVIERGKQIGSDILDFTGVLI
jgi:hypothetical protein